MIDLDVEAGRWARIVERPMPHGLQGAYDAGTDTIYLDAYLTPVQRVCVLAHEISHAKHDDHGCHADKWTERRADMEAALMLINPTEYATAEQVCDNPHWLAKELGVMPWVIQAYRDAMHETTTI